MTVPQKISVVMVSCQTGKYLDRILEGVLGQEGDVELVLVNNGNPPDVEAGLVERFKDSSNVRLMTGHGDIGVVKGRNLGARVATGEFLLFLDDTCLLPKGSFSFVLAEAAKMDKPYFFGARILDTKGQEKKWSRCALLTPPVAFVNRLGLAEFFPHLRFFLHGEPVSQQTSPVPAFGGSFLFIPKDIFEKNRGFEERYIPELSVMDFCLRLFRNGVGAYVLPRLAVKQAPSTEPPYDPKTEKERLMNIVRYFFEDFSDSYPQPVLWALYVVYGIVFALGAARRRKTAVL